MSTAGATGAAHDAGVETGPPVDVEDVRLTEALAELAAAEVRVAKVEANLEGVRASRAEAEARVAELRERQSA